MNFDHELDSDYGVMGWLDLDYAETNATPIVIEAVGSFVANALTTAAVAPQSPGGTLTNSVGTDAVAMEAKAVAGMIMSALASASESLLAAIATVTASAPSVKAEISGTGRGSVTMNAPPISLAETATAGAAVTMSAPSVTAGLSGTGVGAVQFSGIASAELAPRGVGHVSMNAPAPVVDMTTQAVPANVQFAAISSVTWVPTGVSTVAMSAQAKVTLTAESVGSALMGASASQTWELSGIGTATFSAVATVSTPIAILSPPSSMILSGVSTLAEAVTAVATFEAVGAALAAFEASAVSTATMSGASTLSEAAQAPSGTSTLSGLGIVSEATTAPPASLLASSPPSSLAHSATGLGTFDASAVASASWKMGDVGTSTFSGGPVIAVIVPIAVFGVPASISLSAAASAMQTATGVGTTTLSSPAKVAEALTTPPSNISMQGVTRAAFEAAMQASFLASGGAAASWQASGVSTSTFSAESRLGGDQVAAVPATFILSGQGALAEAATTPSGSFNASASVRAEFATSAYATSTFAAQAQARFSIGAPATVSMPATSLSGETTLTGVPATFILSGTAQAAIEAPTDSALAMFHSSGSYATALMAVATVTFPAPVMFPVYEIPDRPHFVLRVRDSRARLLSASDGSPAVIQAGEAGVTVRIERAGDDAPEIERARSLEPTLTKVSGRG